MLKWRYAAAVIAAVALTAAVPAVAEPLKVLSAGAFKQVLLGIIPQFEKGGTAVQLDSDTVGGLLKRVEAGESFDLLVASPAALDTLKKAGKVGDNIVNLARVGVGVGVKEGTERPSIATVDAFKQALLKARAVTYVDPAAGGTSGIYVSQLIDRLGIGPEVRAKSVLVKGGSSADRIVSGEADIAVQQISEILPVKGVVLVGPLPAEIQNYTIYAAAVSPTTPRRDAAEALIRLVQSQPGADVIRAKGMEPAP